MSYVAMGCRLDRQPFFFISHSSSSSFSYSLSFSPFVSLHQGKRKGKSKVQGGYSPRGPSVLGGEKVIWFSIAFFAFRDLGIEGFGDSTGGRVEKREKGKRRAVSVILGRSPRGFIVGV
jgi:hypothetical protein